MNNNINVTVGDGFKLGLGFTLGSFVASIIVVPAILCGGFILTTILGGTMGALLNNLP